MRETTTEKHEAFRETMSDTNKAKNSMSVGTGFQ